MDEDIRHYESYGFTREEAIAQAKADRASTGLMMAVFRLFFICFKWFFLVLPSIFWSYLIVEKIKGPFKKADNWDIFWWMCGSVYLLECLVFFLKGWQISLRQRGNRIWIVIISVCILYCFAFPVVMFQVWIAEEINRNPRSHVSPVQVIAWIAGILLGWLIYRRYNLTKDEAPRFVWWAFRLGRYL
jgi:hypothetical protein